MSDGQRLPVSRRRLLLGVSSIGVGAVLGGIGTYSLQNEQEQLNVRFTHGLENENNNGDNNGNGDGGGGGGGGQAGEFDLGVNLIAFHNNSLVEGTLLDQDEENSNTLVIQSKEMYPGDHGAIYMGLEMLAGSGSVRLSCESKNFRENYPNSDDTEGELQEIVNAEIGQLPSEPSFIGEENPSADLPPEFASETHFNGKVEELSEALVITDLPEISEGETAWLAYYWSFPVEAGNEYQGDSYDIELTFEAQSGS